MRLIDGKTGGVQAAGVGKQVYEFLQFLRAWQWVQLAGKKELMHVVLHLSLKERYFCAIVSCQKWRVQLER